MKMRTFGMIALTFFLLVAASPSNTPFRGVDITGIQPGKPLRNDEPIEAVITDLEEFIPIYMQQQGVPGVAIALVRDGQVAWTGEYGVKNILTKDPITPDTTFKVASNSKVVTAYIALRLVDQGLLTLETPLNNYLSKPWLPEKEFRQAIKLRHVLSHNSGMGATSRSVRFKPGYGYSYTAQGFLYTQAVVEEISGKSLEALAQDLVFQPLGMKHTSFESIPAVMLAPASGHLPTIVPTLFFVVPFIFALLLTGILTFVYNRIRIGRWQISKGDALVVYPIVFMLACVPGLLLSGSFGMWDYSILIISFGLIFMTIFSLAVGLGATILGRLLPQHTRIRRMTLALWALGVIVALSASTVKMGDVPLLGNAPVRANSAGTIRSTAADMARFLIEIANPKYLSPGITTQMHTPQVSLRWNLSWGLGPGIYDTTNGDALWQWGQAPDFQSVMVIYPELGYGAVVLANSDFLNPDVAIQIAHRALGGEIDAILRASHLEFNRLK